MNGQRPAGILKQRALAVETTRTRADRARDAANAARAEWPRLREVWIQAERGVKALRELRERGALQHRRDQERREGRALDEAGLRRRNRLLPILATLLCFAAAPPVIAEEKQNDDVAAGIDRSALSAERLLLEIRSRKASLDEREHELDARESSVVELEARVSERIEELKSVRLDLAQRLSVLDEESEARVQTLTKVYAAMPPNRAAPLLEAIDADLATAILRRMKTKKSAAVIALMSQEEALLLSRRVAQPFARVEGK